VGGFTAGAQVGVWWAGAGWVIKVKLLYQYIIYTVGSIAGYTIFIIRIEQRD
jgi:hypothetical protein